MSIILNENDLKNLVFSILREDDTFGSAFGTDNSTTTTTQQSQTVGNANLQLYKQLNIPGFDINKFNCRFFG